MTKKTKKVSKKKTVLKKISKNAVKKKPKRKLNAAFMSPMIPSVSLAVVVGSEPIPRTEVVKKLWAYIKTHNLQDPNNRRNILADSVLLKVFDGKQTVSMFEMTKLVNKHLSKTA